MPALFVWDEDKAESNHRKHGISFDEAQTVFLDELSITRPDPEHSQEEERLIILGMSNKRRLLVVSFAEGGKKIRLISARKATRVERKQYEEEDLT
jgi:uncharacterized DUF497 family protein